MLDLNCTDCKSDDGVDDQMQEYYVIGVLVFFVSVK